MKRARTTEEMKFAASLQACPTCGTHELGELILKGNDEQWFFTGDCPSCRTSRTFKFATFGDPHATPASTFELGKGASELISPDEFLAEYQRVVAMIPTSPQLLAPPQWKEAAASITRALTCINELLKLVPAGGRDVPGAADPRLRKTWLDEQATRVKKLLDAYVADKERNAAEERKSAPPRPVGSVDATAFRAHEEWVRRGKTGAGRMVLERHQLAGRMFGAVELSGVRIVGSDLSNVDLSYAVLDGAELENDVLTGAGLDAATLTGATISGGTWTRAKMAVAKLVGAKVTGTDFTEADLERSSWKDARVTKASFVGVRFGNASFDQAVFEGCNFRNASFSKIQRMPEPTSRGARFVDCDLRGTDWTGRDLRQTTFVRCTLVGAHGKALSTEGIVLESCDLDQATFVAALREVN